MCIGTEMNEENVVILSVYRVKLETTLNVF